MSKKYTFEEFVEVIETLRGEHGCPWDKAQTHESLRPCMMEEAAELLGAIRIYKQTGNAENMQEELGDILLQSVMHSVIAKEEGLFTIEDVITGISEKMIRRHPHIFTEEKTTDTERINQNWEEIKKQEKQGKEWITSPLREIPAELPSLTRAVKIAKKLDKLPEYQHDQKSVVPDCDTLVSLLKEQSVIMESLVHTQETDADQKKSLEKQVQQMLRTISQLCYRLKLQPEQLLYDDIEEIIEKMEKN